VVALAFLTVALAEAAKQTPAAEWPLWENYARRFIDARGRVIDYDAANRTTSEGQSYALFFSLVANDRGQFDRVLGWTADNLSRGDITKRLPAWLWGQGDFAQWKVLDENSASDSDLWIAYTLVQAGRLWQEPQLTKQGLALARRMADAEVRYLRGLGDVLLPGSKGFRPSKRVYQLNPSYMPLQLLLGLAEADPKGPWARIAERVPDVIKGAAREGFALDWVAYREQEGFHDCPLPRPEAEASYDAIRVYLWAGMLHPQTPGRPQILESIQGMANYLEKNDTPPAIVSAEGEVRDPNGGVGFSAATLPYLSALGRKRGLERQQRRLNDEYQSATGLYGEPARYYDQNLILFASGWQEGRFGFERNGNLEVHWRR
jgi:endoglucanase